MKPKITTQQELTEAAHALILEWKAPPEHQDASDELMEAMAINWCTQQLLERYELAPDIQKSLALEGIQQEIEVEAKRDPFGGPEAAAERLLNRLEGRPRHDA